MHSRAGCLLLLLPLLSPPLIPPPPPFSPSLSVPSHPLVCFIPPAPRLPPSLPPSLPSSFPPIHLLIVFPTPSPFSNLFCSVFKGNRGNRDRGPRRDSYTLPWNYEGVWLGLRSECIFPRGQGNNSHPHAPHAPRPLPSSPPPLLPQLLSHFFFLSHLLLPSFSLFVPTSSLFPLLSPSVVCIQLSCSRKDWMFDGPFQRSYPVSEEYQEQIAKVRDALKSKRRYTSQIDVDEDEEDITVCSRSPNLPPSLPP
eukprot:757826-Hanusia_phi.AAC.1